MKKNLFSSETTILLVLFFGSIATLFHSYLLFHITSELFAMVVAFSIFTFAWNSRNHIKDGGLVIIAAGFLMVGVVDLIHTLAYKGMNLFADDTNLATELWIVGRYLAATTFLISTFFIGKPVRDYVTMCGFVIVTFVLVAMVFTGVFPDCFVEGEGLTTFKIASEYLVMAILAVALVRFRRSILVGEIRASVIISIAVMIVSELFFTLYLDPYGATNIIGHILKVISYYLLFRATVEAGLNRPMHMLYTNLKNSEDKNRSSHILLVRQARFSGAAEAVSNIAHHWRQPLSVIAISLGDIKELYLAGELTKEELVNSIDRSMEAIGKISSQIESVRSQYRTEHSIKMEDVAQTIESTIALVKDEMELLGVDLIRDIDNVFVRSYHRELIQVVFNVLKNSLEIFKEREIKSPKIWISASKTKDGAKIEIADNGGGFDRSIRNSIFEPYTTTKHKSFGIGLGLYVTKLIVEEHLNGTIDAKDRSGGAVVTITIGSLKG